MLMVFMEVEKERILLLHPIMLIHPLQLEATRHRRFHGKVAAAMLRKKNNNNNIQNNLLPTFGLLLILLQ